MMILNAPVQNFMVPRKQRGHFLWILLCQFRAAFNIREKESNGARWEIIHYRARMQTQVPVFLSWRNLYQILWRAHKAPADV